MNKNQLILLAFILFQFTLNGYSQSPVKKSPSTTNYGPEKGALILIGGGKITPEIWTKFTDLAGGAEKASIVVVTAAIGDSAAIYNRSVEMIKKETKIQNVTLLHTNDKAIANSEEFIAPLKKATGIFFVGGRQWRIADSYLNTLTHKAFLEVLERGGVIAGTSAGATIQGSFLWRGDTRGAQILVGDHTQGLAFLRNSVIDQHLLTRNRQFDLVEFIKTNPSLIGIGIDESTAVVVYKDTFEVIGKSYVAIYDYQTIVKNAAKQSPEKSENYNISGGPFFFLHQGQKYDMASRRIIQSQSAQSIVK